MTTATPERALAVLDYEPGSDIQSNAEMDFEAAYAHLDRRDDEKIAEARLHDDLDYSHERGATTAEYAVVTLAAVGLAGILIVLLRSDGVRGLLWDIISGALSV